MTDNVSIHEAETQLSQLLERVAKGERIVVSRAGEPIADLVPHQRAPVVLGGMRGELTYDDAFAELDPDIQRMFYGDAGAAS